MSLTNAVVAVPEASAVAYDTQQLGKAPARSARGQPEDDNIVTTYNTAMECLGKILIFV